MSYNEKPNINPGYNYGAVTPNDTNKLDSFARALWIGGSGDIAVVNPDGTAVTFAGVVAGTMLPIQTNRVMSTNTTATNIVAIF